MHKTRSKKRSKWWFLRNLRKYQTDLKNNGVKMMVTTLPPRKAIFYVGAGSKNCLNYGFCVTEGSRNMKFEILVTY